MKRRNLPLVGIILALSVALGLVAFRGTAETQADPHYACYMAPGSPFAEPPIITLDTQFGSEEGVEVLGGEMLCNPAGKHGEPFPPEAPHLRWFKISAPELMPTRYVNVSDQFGSWENVPVGDPLGLLSPALKTFGPLPSEDPPLDPHYKCYALPDLGPGGEPVLVKDQFYPQGFDWWVSTTPNRLCLPAGKNSPDIPAASHLLCHAASGPMPWETVNLKTQFAEETVFVEMAMELCAPATKVEVEPEQYPSFSIDLNSVSAVVFDAADILFNPGFPAVGIPCANLGLLGCGGGDDLDALSYGDDFGNYSGYIGFSVDTGAQGLANTAVEVEANCQNPEPEADEFVTTLALDNTVAGLYGYGDNVQRLDGDGVPCGTNSGMSMGLQEPSGDDLDALDRHDPSFVDDGTGGGIVGDGIPDRWVYFSLQPGSTTLAGMAVPPTGRPGSPADILVTANGAAPGVYAAAELLGLEVGDDVDGMCLAQMDSNPEQLDPDDSINPDGLQDYLFFTLAAGSPSLAGGLDPGDILYVDAVGSFVLVDQEYALGLAKSTDDVNAMKCVKGLVDISIDDFVVELPDGTQVRPGDSETLYLTESEWATLTVWEDKGYTPVSAELSPATVTSQVGWSVIPSMGIPPINVVWQSQPGDVCTLDGAVVDCDPDVPSTHDIDDIHFNVDLNPQRVTREVQLHCKEVGQEVFTFVNYETPLGANDIDPSSNLSMIDLNIVCEEAPVEPHYQCYDIFPPQWPGIPFVELITQFGSDLVEVGESAQLCAPAVKNGEGDLTDPHLKCYEIWGQDPDVVVNLETQFGIEENVEVGPARLLCMGAAKEVIFPDPTYCCDACPGYPMCFDAPTFDVCLQYGCAPVAGATCLNPLGMCEPLAAPQPPADLHYECFDISATGHDPPDVVNLLQDQFGLKFDVDVGPAELLCAPALKEGIGTLDAPHLKCYQIPPEFPGEYWLYLETQWGPEFDVMLYESRWLCVEATKEIVELPEDPSFSIQRDGPSTIPSNPFGVDPADILVYGPATAVPCPALGLMACGGDDDIDALSIYGDWDQHAPDGLHWLAFSVTEDSMGAAGTAVNGEYLCRGGLPPATGSEPEADEFESKTLKDNQQVFDGDGVACDGNAGYPMNLAEPAGDDLDALDDDVPDSAPPAYFSLDPASPTLMLLPGTPADIFVSWWGGDIAPYATFDMLGLTPEDDVDAICVWDQTDETWFDPMQDVVAFSLAAGSATLAMQGFSAADVLITDPMAPGAPPMVYVWAEDLGLNPDIDDLNALKCYIEPEDLYDDLDEDEMPDAWEAQQWCDGVPPGLILGGDWDNDLLADEAEYLWGTDPCNPDTDGDGCADSEEPAPGTGPKTPGATGSYNPLFYFDYFDVPVPALNVDPTGVRTGAVTMADVLATLQYVGTKPGKGPNANGADYDTDINLNGVVDGLEYDRSPSPVPNPPWDAGPPSGAVTMADVLAVLAQVGRSCNNPP